MTENKKSESANEDTTLMTSLSDNFFGLVSAPYNIGKFCKTFDNQKSESNLEGRVGAILGGAIAVPALMIQSYVAYKFGEYGLPELPAAAILGTNLYGVLNKWIK